MNEPVEARHLSVDLGTHPNHEQVRRAAGLAAMRAYEAERGLFTEVERVQAGARTGRLFEPADGDHSDPRQGGPLDRSGV
ncbi:hypothetical protein [Streptomyces sp. NBC_00576]|uniref:hypothetical protein n=1 Tax=Streptomyces sp. NBC_00576 TaxID=2903665 RepID=UPI002E818E2D|nr:hypothetical protein [Streptomyces sp. NBC_00576]WUB73272.1 hypothetical protein OG734_26095 [Streptomyces sp. NBC_00576]